MRLSGARCSRVCFLCVTWQRDALLVARLPLAVLVHRAALAAGLLVADERRVIFGADFVLHDGSLGAGGGGTQTSVSGSQRLIFRPDAAARFSPWRRCSCFPETHTGPNTTGSRWCLPCSCSSPCTGRTARYPHLQKCQHRQRMV